MFAGVLLIMEPAQAEGMPPLPPPKDKNITQPGVVKETPKGPMGGERPRNELSQNAINQVRESPQAREFVKEMTQSVLKAEVKKFKHVPPKLALRVSEISETGTVKMQFNRPVSLNLDYMKSMTGGRRL